MYYIPSMHYNNTTQDIKDKIIAAYSSGMRLSEIEKTGIACWKTIKKVLIEAGIPTTRRPAHNFDDKSGKRYGRLVVLSLNGYKHYTENGGRGRKKKRAVWLCRCDCGSEISVPSLHLTTGNTQSCGCLFTRAVLQTNQQKRLRSRVASAKHSHWLRYQNSAKERGYAWALSREEFYLLSEGSCHYCGIAPGSIATSGLYSSYTYNGIDRVDNAIGYTVANCVTCCKFCNHGKYTQSSQDWVARCHRIAERHPKK